MKRVLFMAASIAILAACEPLVLPIDAQLDIEVPLPDTTAWQETIAADGGYDFEESTGKQDITSYINEITPDMVGSVNLELESVTIMDPEGGRIADYVDHIAVYLSTDDILSEDDELLAEFTAAQFAEGELTAEIRTDLPSNISLIAKGRLIAIPDGGFSLPVKVKGVATVSY